MSKNIRILITEPEYFTEDSIKRMKKIGRVTASRMARRELLRAVADADALVIRVETKVDAEVIARAKKLRCVVTTTTGLNHIDTEALKARGIALFSLTGTHSTPTAEHAIALLMAAARNIPAAQSAMNGGSWKRWEYIGVELEGKTLGLFGTGRIGLAVAERARALHLNVIAYDPYVSEADMATRGIRKVEKDALLAESDFISLHALLTPETEGFFDKKAFGAMKRSAIIINAARGAIINEKALLDALAQGRIRAAALDVYPEEPLPASSPLRRYAKTHKNLVLTPHIAASTEEAVQRASNFAVESIENFFKT